MATYLVRRQLSNNIALREIALINATTVLDLFWTVDEFGNPYEYEYCKIKHPSGYGMMLDYHIEDSEDEEAITFSTSNCKTAEICTERLREAILDKGNKWKEFPEYGIIVEAGWKGLYEDPKYVCRIENTYYTSEKQIITGMEIRKLGKGIPGTMDLFLKMKGKLGRLVFDDEQIDLLDKEIEKFYYH